MTLRFTRTPLAVAVRGAVALAFGAVTLAWPAMTVSAFVALFAALAVCDGAAAAAAAVRFRRRGRDVAAARDPLFLLALAGTAVGVAAAAWPDLTMQALLTLVASWAAVTGVGHLLVVRPSVPRPPGSWLVGAAGVAALALAALIGLTIASGGVRVGWEVGVYGVISGMLLLAAAGRLQLALANEPRRRTTDGSTAAERTAEVVHVGAVEPAAGPGWS
jgi:uncharacterized membrane protein HdeD (DUF308 family)